MTCSRAILAPLAALLLASAACVSNASPLGLRYSATAGPVYAPGPNSADLSNALGVQFEGARGASLTLEWFGALTYHDFGSVTLPELRLGSGSNGLYFPEYELNQPYRGYGLELGLRRRYAVRGLELFIEGAAGVARSEQPRAGQRFASERRPDPLLELNHFSGSGTGASFSLGAGGVIARNGRVGLVTAVSARWQSALGVSGPIVPLRLGLSWPVEPAEVAAVRAGVGALAAQAIELPPRGPRLRLGVGTAWLDAPPDVWESSIPAAGFSAGVEVPLPRGFALRFDGTQSLFVSTERSVAWQESDVFGNLYTYYSADSPHWTVTFLTAGLSASATRGAWTPYLHAGAGLGRTGGDGTSIQVTAPTLPPTVVTGYQGFGFPQTGFAWTGGAGLEYAVAPTWSAFLEGTTQGVNLDAPDVQVFALRTGVVLR